MALITAPTLPLKQIQWTLDTPAQVNFGIGGERNPDDPLYSKLYAQVDLDTITSEAAFCPIRSFLFRCNGLANSFHLPATVEPQNTDSGVTVGADAAAGDTSLTLAGYSATLLDGHVVTVNGQALLLSSDQSGAVITFEPPLREAAATGTAVETANPYALVRMANAQFAYQIDPPARFTLSFDVEEIVGG